MSNEHLRRDPQDLDENVWWYEEMKGIEIHVDIDFPQNKGCHRSYMIPWCAIRAALKRKDK